MVKFVRTRYDAAMRGCPREWLLGAILWSLLIFLDSFVPAHALAAPNRDPRFQLLQAEAALKEKRFDEALRLVGLVLQDRPEFADALVMRARIRWVQEQTGEALSDLTAALRVEPRCVEAFVLRAEIKLKGRNHQEALADLSRAIELDGKHRSAYLLRAQVYNSLGRHAEAIGDITTHLKVVNPKDAVALTRRGQAYFRSGQLEQALADLGEGIKLDPKNPDPFYERAQIHERTEKLAEALADYTKHLEL